VRTTAAWLLAASWAGAAFRRLEAVMQVIF
jgi:hypothetical protein